MAFAEDFAEFMDTETGFAEDVVIGVAEGVGVFDAEWADVMSMGAPRPALTIVDSDFPGIVIGADASVRDTNYTVQEIRPDGTGMSLLILELA
jgi:hypothetical protein